MRPSLRSLLLAVPLCLAACGGGGADGAGACQGQADCDDANACTLDSCQAGACAHAPVSIDDGNLCTADACAPASGVTHVPVPVDDGDPQTVDSCDPATGAISHTPSCAAGCPAGTFDLDGNPLTGACGCEYACAPTSAGDPIDAAYVDANCDGGDGVVADCVYVAPGGDDLLGTGVRAAPLRTIAAGLAAAVAGGVHGVCLGAGIYQEPVTLPSGVSLLGGFDQDDPDFPFRRRAGVTSTVEAIGAAIVAPLVEQETHVAGLTVVVTAPVTPGATAAAVVLGGGAGPLVVHLNHLAVGPGRPGADGADAPPPPPRAEAGWDGQPGSSGTASGGLGGVVPTCDLPGGKGGDGGYDAADGEAGGDGFATVGLPPLGGPGGVATGECTQLSGSGQPGHDGAAGGDGASGAGGDASGFVDAGGAYHPAQGGDGVRGGDGQGGGGGGGGAGGARLSLGLPAGCLADRGGGGGSGGCGGLGGGAGGGGGGGGASFGVVAAGGQVEVRENVIATSAGGSGGRGGDSSAGQLPGDRGRNTLDAGAFDDAGGGAPGGIGGGGGAGGPGGGGGGGPSACLAHGSAAAVSTAANACTTGAPGAGGLGGVGPRGAGGAGATGVTAAVLALP